MFLLYLKGEILKSRLEIIKKIIKQNAKSIFIFSNGLTSREANFFQRNEKSFYLLHAMGEALSIGIGIAKSKKKLKIVVVDGDYNALMGSASWHHLAEIKNLKYYILNNNISQTTGSQKLLKLNIPKNLNKKVYVLNINNKNTLTPNPEDPILIKKRFVKYLSKLS